MSRLFGESAPRKNQRQENVPSHIFTPRSYQVEILDSALDHNTIVCLGTDAGKSFIAVMLIKELAHQVRPSFSAGARRTIYLTNTVTSVETQAHIVRRQTDLSVGQYESQQAVDHWTRQRWVSELEVHHVLVMTPEVLQHLLEKEHLALTQVNLIIFDECHLAVTDHPYSQIMQQYKDCIGGEHLPRVLGLTTSILNHQCTSPGDLERSLHSLEDILQSVAETSTDMIVSDLYGAKPKEVILQSEEYVDKTGLVAKLNEMLESALMFMGDCSPVWLGKEGDQDPRLLPRTVLQECQSILHSLGPWCAGRVAQALTKQLIKLEEAEADEKQRLLLQLTNTKLRMIHTMVDHEYENTVQCLEDFLLYMSPKVIQLIETLRKYKPDDNFMIIGDDDFTDMDFGSEISDDSMDLSDDDSDDDMSNSKYDRGSKAAVHYVAVKRTLAPEVLAGPGKQEEEGLCGIVFVERRHTAFALNKLIQELCNWDADLYFVQSSHITGQGGQKPGSGVRDNEVMFRKQEEVLRKFRNKEVNLLVSTNVLEEGVDVPRCNLVVRFDGPTDYRSYVQSKGRARAPRAKFYILVDGPSMSKFKADLERYKGIESILVGRCQSKEDLQEETVDLEEADKLLVPYVPNPEDEDAQVSMSTAVLLVNRYCAKLPSDAFTHLTPKCSNTTTLKVDSPETSFHVVTLQLPINSPIKQPIVGEAMTSKRLAKMAVALKACEILHKAGELDDHLQPVGKEVIKYEDEEGEWEGQEAQGQARPGTTKRKQYYYKKPADALIGRPQLDSTCHLYNVKMVLTCPITEEQNTRGRKIHDPEETLRGFGLLIEKRIPLVPQFPVFTRSGEVTISIDLVSDDMVITQEDYERLKHFHHMVFTRVLRLEKDPMTFDLDSALTSYIVVPLLKDPGGEDLSIDWQFIGVVERATLTKKRCVLYEKTKEKFVFNKETFEDAVVMPSYRNIDQPQYFYVAEIRHDLNPRSPFPSPELYDTFEHYYTSKYNLEITSLQQPLLDVDHTSARLNLLTPRYMNQKGVALPTSSAETRRARRENLQQKQILVPELCDVHPFPASLWRKAVCLPAILYRMNCLLIAEEIRMMISKGAMIGRIKLEDTFRFPQLEFGFSTKPSSVISEAEKTATSTEAAEEDKSQEAVDSEIKAVTCDNTTHKTIEDECEEDQQEKIATVQENEMLESANIQVSDSKQEDETLKSGVTSIQDPGSKTRAIIKCEFNHLASVNGPLSKIKDYKESVCTQEEGNPKGINSKDKGILNSVCRKSCDSCCRLPLNRGLAEFSELESVEATNSKNVSCICHCIGNERTASGVCLNSKTDGKDISEPLYVDTEVTCVKGSEIDASFHTPSEILPGPSSSTSVSSYYTAEGSLSVESSPAHLPYLPNHVGKLNMHDKLISVDDDKIFSSTSGLTSSDCTEPSSHISTSSESGTALSCLCSPPGSRQGDAAPLLSERPGLDPLNNPLKAGSDCDNEGVRLHVVDADQGSASDAACSNSLRHLETAEPTSRLPTPGANISCSDSDQGENRKNHESPVNNSNEHNPTVPEQPDTITIVSKDTVTDKEEDGSSIPDKEIDTGDLSDKLTYNVAIPDKQPGAVNIPAQDTGDVTDKIPDIVDIPDKTQDTGDIPDKIPDIVDIPDKVEDTGDMPDKKPDIVDIPDKEEDTGDMPNRKTDVDIPDKEEDTGDIPDKEEDTGNIPDKEEDTGDIPDKKPDIVDIPDKVEDTCDMPDKNPGIVDIPDKNPGIVDIPDKEEDTSDIPDKNPGIVDIPDKNPGIVDIPDKEEGTGDIPDKNPGIVDIPDEELEASSTTDGQLRVNSEPSQPAGSQQGKDQGSVSDENSAGKTKAEEEEEDCSPLITFDDKVHLPSFVGPSPCVILQTLTMSNANDFFNLERLETIGDSFLKFAITVYLYCSYPGIHEGKLSYLRSKQVSNYNLYKLGKKKGFPDCMVAAKFEPTENWLPPGFVIKTSDAYKGINVLIASSKNKYEVVEDGSEKDDESELKGQGLTPEEKYKQELEEATRPEESDKPDDPGSSLKCLIPYNLQTQHSLPDKSIADCVEALIGCYLTTCGQRAALQFMSWLGLKVLPEMDDDNKPVARQSTNCNILMTSININRPVQVVAGFGKLQAPSSPLLTHVPNATSILAHHLDGYEAFEKRIKYKFKDQSYLLQAFTHASYHYNTITDCYQRLEFLGDAILDYVITRHLFEDVKKHSPGILTDLRSALVNNNIFAALAVKWDFHKYFKAISPQLFNVIEKFVSWQKAKHDEISLDEEFDDAEEEKDGESEDIEIPKALGDIFESVAGAIYLDSGMSLDTVWRVYYRMMKPQIDAFTSKIPKSPVRELLELEPETAKFEKPERTLDGKIRVTVNVVGKGEFRGVGRNYRIAKSAAAKRALKFIRQLHLQMEAHAAHMMSLGLPQGMPSFTRHHILDE